jgi:murein DD-endopeptidase
VRRGLPLATLVLAVTVLMACAGRSAPLQPQSVSYARSASAAPPSARTQAVRVATSMIGTPYRYGGSSPRGFDCSGLVVYSYKKAGAPGLPRSAAALGRRVQPIPLSELRPGDLLFFRLDGNKISHVAIYVGDHAFVHAPSRGKRVERVRLDHVYWQPRIARAGRLEF